MHIQDGLLMPINPATNTLNIADTTVLAATWAITIPFLIYSWKKVRSQYSAGFASTLAVLSAAIFIVQMLTFPVMGGTSVHVLGGTLLVIILGPYAGMLGMTLVLAMQAVFFADGGLLAFGANAVNMAVVASISFFAVKFLAGKGGNKRFFVSIFIATFASAVLTAILTGLEVGVSQAFANSGGVILTVPSMLVVYSIEGVVEATLTSFLGTALVYMPMQFKRATLGLRILRRNEPI